MANPSKNGNSPAIQLSTKDWNRPLVEIDGDPYYMIDPLELRRDTMKQMMAVANRLQDIDTNDIDTMADALEESVGVIMIDLPDEVRDKLTLMQQSKIVKVFFDLQADPTQEGGTETNESMTSSPSPGASDSTEVASESGVS